MEDNVEVIEKLWDKLSKKQQQVIMDILLTPKMRKKREESYRKNYKQGQKDYPSVSADTIFR
jgi:predicted Fe-S protein YdhL (DUF1289 family)